MDDEGERVANSLLEEMIVAAAQSDDPQSIVRSILEHCIPEDEPEERPGDAESVARSILERSFPQEHDEAETIVPDLIDELIDDAVDQADKLEEEEEEEEEEGEKKEEEEDERSPEEKRKVKCDHWLSCLYGYHAKETPFRFTFSFFDKCVVRLTDNTRELLLRGNDLVLRVGRRLGDDDVSHVLMYLDNNPDISTLDVAYNDITDGGVMSIVRYLEEGGQLRRINLMNNDITAWSLYKLREIGDGLALESLRLNGNHLGDEGGQLLAELVNVAPKLAFLDVAQCDMTHKSLSLLLDSMRCNTRIYLLNLSRPLPQPGMPFDSALWAENVGAMLQGNRALVELYLQKSSLCCHDMVPLLRGLRANKTLRLLDLTANNVGDRGAELIAEYLKSGPPLLVLFVAHCIITDHGGRALSRGVPSSQLHLLDLSYNRMTDEGIIAVLDGSKKPYPMRGLFIWGNTITHNACQVIRRMLLSKALMAETLDVEPYRVDGVDSAAYVHVNRVNAIFYCVSRFGYPPWYLLEPPDKLPPPPPPHRPPPPPPPPRQPLPQEANVCPRRPIHSKRRMGVAAKERLCPHTLAHARLTDRSPHYCS